MPGLDPGIHTDCQHVLRFIMDRGQASLRSLPKVGCEPGDEIAEF
jgi:hypothetical protein